MPPPVIVRGVVVLVGAVIVYGSDVIVGVVLVLAFLTAGMFRAPCFGSGGHRERA